MPAGRKDLACMASVVAEALVGHWKAWLMRCASEGVSMRDEVLRAIQYFQGSRQPATRD